jgi:nucleoside-diphosphate-sugar epimerase
MALSPIGVLEALLMRVFVTGATGHLGSVIVPELLEAGHQVVGLARSESSADALASRGVQARRGTLDDLDVLRDAAAASDGVIHLAFKHDDMRAGDYLGAVDADLAAVRTLGAALSGTDKPLVISSGTLMLTFGNLGRTGTEDDAIASGPRVDAENAVIGFATQGVRSSVVRLSPVIHSTMDRHGFVPTLIDIARRTGVSGYPGDGANRWPAAHSLDAAHLYRLALEQAPAGSRLHAVGDEGIPVRVIAEAIGRNLNVPVASVPPERAEAHFGFLAGMLALDNPTSNAGTRELVGWEPTHPGLIEDLDQGHYFARD